MKGPAIGPLRIFLPASLRSDERGVSSSESAATRSNRPVLGDADPRYNPRAHSVIPGSREAQPNFMSKSYRAADIEVLSGLEPVRRRPGMYTDTTRPNHLAHEVIDNSVDEAIAGYAKRIEVNVYAVGSLEDSDDRPVVPVDLVTCE